MEETPVEKDDSRPFFQRGEGEIGIYITVYDARPEEAKSYGSEHFFLMDLTDRLLEYLRATDVLKFRANMERKGVFSGAYIERFETGIVMALGFDDIESMDSVWKLHRNGRLNAILQDTLISAAVLKKFKVARITLKSKLWDDEYKACQTELLERKAGRVSLYTKEKDTELVKRLKTHEQKLNQELQNIRELESTMEHKLGDFMFLMKQMLPQNITTIKSLKEFDTYVKVAKGTNFRHTEPVDLYKSIIEKHREIFRELVAEVVVPLLQVHAICESDKQKTLKRQIRQMCYETQEKYKQDHDLQSVSHPDWKAKMHFREQTLFLGVLSLVPIGLQSAIDVDVMLDEYVNDFPVNFL